MREESFINGDVPYINVGVDIYFFTVGYVE